MPKYSFASLTAPALLDSLIKLDRNHHEQVVDARLNNRTKALSQLRIKYGPCSIRPSRVSATSRVRLPSVFSAKVWVVAATLAGMPMTTNAAVTSLPMSTPAVRPWFAYLQKLESQIQATAAVQSAQAGVKANQAAVSAQTGDRDLSLDGSYADYPNGTGTGTGGDGSFTNLEQRGEIRASWGLLDFLARRPGRIDSAKAQVQAARAGMAYTRRDNQQALISRSVAAWAAQYQRQALQNAMRDIHSANNSLDELRNHALNTRLTDAVTQASSQALELQSQVEQSLASLPESEKALPAPPSNYWALPLNPPATKPIKRMAHDDLRAQELRYESKSFDAQSRAHWAENFHFKIYGGYIRQTVRDQPGSQSGPEVGATLSVPIGGGGSGMRANARWQARQMDLAADAAVEQQSLLLQQMRQQWRQSAANLRSQVNLISHQAQQLGFMLKRYSADASSRTPEPWQIRLEGAQFWLSVADTWKTRGQWIESVLTWSLYDNGNYLKAGARPTSTAAPDNLCTPLRQCPQV